MNRLGLEHLTVVGMPPPDVVSLAAAAGMRSVGLHPERLEFNPFGFPNWSLVSDAALRRETRMRLQDNGVALGLADACAIRDGIDVSCWQPHIDAFVELGAERINISSWDPDPGRSFDQFCKFAEMTHNAGLPVVYEYIPARGFRRIDDVAEAIARSGFTHLGILIDCMHYFRGGHKLEDMARFDAALFKYVQFCDAPLRGERSYLHEALSQRLLPGEGELPLRALLAALPRDIPVSIELPHQRLVDAGVTHAERVGRTVAAARAVLDELDPQG